MKPSMDVWWAAIIFLSQLIPSFPRRCLRKMSHLINPSKLIKKQNTPSENADALNLKTRETMISDEPANTARAEPIR